MRWGLEAWNTPTDGTPEERERIKALGGGCIKLRAYHPPSLLDLMPLGLVLLRRSADGEIWPAGQVEEIRHLVEGCKTRGIKAIYILDNEPNLETGHYRKLGTNAMSQYFADLGRLIEAMRTAYPRLEFCSPPMAVMQDDLFWADSIESLMRALSVEYRGAHIYWQYGMWCDQAWGKRIDCYQAHLRGQKWIVDEVGDATPNRSAGERATTTLYVLDHLARNRAVEAATVFIAGGTEAWRDFWLPSQELGTIGRTLKQLYGEVVPVPETTYATIGNGYTVIDLRGKTSQDPDPENRYAIRSRSQIKNLVVHHSAADRDSTAEELAQVHLGHGWPGIAYAFVVHWDGRTEYTLDIDRVGYTVGTGNENDLSVCLPGNWSLRQPPQVQLDATKKLLAELRFELGWQVPIAGHRDIAAPGEGTECPGNTWPVWKDKVIPNGVKPAFQFVLGFKELATRLGSAAGRPLENEHPEGLTIQRTTKGMMTWKDGEPSRFWVEVK